MWMEKINIKERNLPNLAGDHKNISDLPISTAIEYDLDRIGCLVINQTSHAYKNK